MMSTAAYLLDPGFRESGIYMKEAMMRTHPTRYYSPAAHAPPAGGDGERAAAAAAAPASIEAYRARVAAKVRDFEDAFWALSDARNRSRVAV